MAVEVDGGRAKAPWWKKVLPLQLRKNEKKKNEKKAGEGGAADVRRTEPNLDPLTSSSSSNSSSQWRKDESHRLQSPSQGAAKNAFDGTLALDGLARQPCFTVDEDEPLPSDAFSVPPRSPASRFTLGNRFGRRGKKPSSAGSANFPMMDASAKNGVCFTGGRNSYGRNANLPLPPPPKLGTCLTEDISLDQSQAVHQSVVHADTLAGIGISTSGRRIKLEPGWKDLAYAACSRRGQNHAHNEDRIQIVEDLLDSKVAQEADSSSSLPLIPYVAVFDGHGGHFCAQFLAQNLHICIRDELLKQDLSEGGINIDFPKAITEGIATCDAKFLSTAGEWNDSSGACAAIALLHGSDLYTANVGDCEAMLFNNALSLFAKVSTAHRASDEGEKKRIESCKGGFVTDNRVVGVLAPSRAFGDSDIKTCHPGVLSIEPHIRMVNLNKDSSSVYTLVLASDGLWERSPLLGIKAVLRRHQSTSKQPKVAEALAQLATKSGSVDDISVVTVAVTF